MSFLRQGMGYPFQIKNGKVRVAKDTVLSMEKTIENLRGSILVPRGVPFWNPALGSDPSPLSFVFDFNDEELEGTIRAAVDTWLEQFAPYVEIVSYVAVRDKEKHHVTIILRDTTNGTEGTLALNQSDFGGV